MPGIGKGYLGRDRDTLGTTPSKDAVWAKIKFTPLTPLVELRRS